MMVLQAARRWLSGLLLIGCLCPATHADEPGPWQEGRLLPHKATRLLVPSGRINLAGWLQGGSTVRLLEVVPEGSRVKQGGRLASFEYPQQHLKTAVEQRIALAEAEGQAAQVGLENRVQKLRAELKIMRYEKKKAELELKKRNVLARRDVQLLELELQRVVEEIDGLKMRIEAQLAVLDAARAYHAVQLEQARAGLAQLAELRRRFQPLAPHAGRVTYPRTLGGSTYPQKGKRLRGGGEFLWLAADDRLQVEFAIEEERLGELRPGQKIQVRAAEGRRTVTAEVIRINPFIEEVNHSKDDRERVFRVQALLPRLKKQAQFQPGKAVRVRW